MLSFIYLRNREYIFENGHISTKTPDLSTNYTIYRFFDKDSFLKKAIFLMKRNEIVKKNIRKY